MSDAGLTHGLSQSLSQSLTADNKFMQSVENDLKNVTSAELNAFLTTQDSQEDGAESAKKAALEQFGSQVLAAKKGAETKRKEQEKTSPSVRVQEASKSAEKNGETAQSRKFTKEFEDAAVSFQNFTVGQVSIQTLRALKNEIKDNDSPETIIQLVEKQLSGDVSLAYEVLNFLRQPGVSEGKEQESLNKAFEKYDEEKGDEARKLGVRNTLARRLSTDEKGETIPLRAEIDKLVEENMHPVMIFVDLYNTYRTAANIFEKISVYLNYCGKLIKDPNIERPHLNSLAKGIYKVLSVKNVFGKMKESFPRLKRSFGAKMPQQLTVENMGKAFIDLVSDLNPTADKVFRLSKQLGIEHSVKMQIEVIREFRDSVKSVSKADSSGYIYRSVQHRDDVYQALVSASDILEDRLDEQEELHLRDELDAAKREDNRPSPDNEKIQSKL